MQCWINGPATGGIDDKIKMAIILLKTNIPAFHHSIIPFSGQIRKPQNTSIFSVGCRNFETFNYTSGIQVRAPEEISAKRNIGFRENTAMI